MQRWAGDGGAGPLLSPGLIARPKNWGPKTNLPTLTLRPARRLEALPISRLSRLSAVIVNVSCVGEGRGPSES